VLHRVSYSRKRANTIETTYKTFGLIPLSISSFLR